MKIKIAFLEKCHLAGIDKKRALRMKMNNYFEMSLSTYMVNEQDIDIWINNETQRYYVHRYKKYTKKALNIGTMVLRHQGTMIVSAVLCRTFCNDGHVLYLWSKMADREATCGEWALVIGLVWPRKWILFLLS